MAVVTNENVSQLEAGHPQGIANAQTYQNHERLWATQVSLVRRRLANIEGQIDGGALISRRRLEYPQATPSRD